MKTGLQIPDFSTLRGPERPGAELADACNLFVGGTLPRPAVWSRDTRVGGRLRTRL
jgi:hypothetical protein